MCASVHVYVHCVNVRACVCKWCVHVIRESVLKRAGVLWWCVLGEGGVCVLGEGGVCWVCVWRMCGEGMYLVGGVGGVCVLNNACTCKAIESDRCAGNLSSRRSQEHTRTETKSAEHGCRRKETITCQLSPQRVNYHHTLL